MSSFCLRYVSVRRFAFSFFAFFILRFALGCSGGLSGTTATPAPTNLIYPQTTVSATVGQAITTVTPAVTGAVSSYSVTPALPAGINLNTTTGAISGTPTTAAAQATYVVTATNASGSTTVSLQVVVIPAVAAPSSLSYPQGSVSATAGQPIIPDIPSFNGTVTSFTVVPALPAGLSLDSSNGTISGTPTDVAAQNSYTVTVSNAGGSTTAAITLAVNKAYTVAIDLGHGSSITAMRSTSTRVLSQDQSGHWVLWDSSSDSKLAEGDQYVPAPWAGTPVYWPIDIAGAVIAIGQSNGIEILSSSDGHLISLIAAPTMIDPVTASGTNAWWKLASDGSYICAGSAAGLAAWTPNGQQVLQQHGDYSKAKVFAAVGQIQVGLGAAGNNVIETIPINGASPVTSAAFSGTFDSWFLDGQRFITKTGTTYWTYSAAGVQQGISALPDFATSVTGQGNWLSAEYYGQVQVYPVGSSSPSATYASTNSNVVASGASIAILSYTFPTGSIVDLSGSAPVKTDFTSPFARLSGYIATGGTKWFVSNDYGLVVDGSSPGVFRALDLGMAWSIAGGTTKAAIGTANGLITYLNPAQPTGNGTISFSSSKVALSTDDTILATFANANSSYLPDRTLNFYSLPSGNLISSLPSQTSDTSVRTDFSLSSSGAAVGQVYQLSNGGYTKIVGPIDGTVAFSPNSTGSDTPLFSADGTLVAVSGGSITTNLYKNGALLTAVTGLPIGWLDNNRLLVANYQNGATSTPQYKDTTIVDITGTVLATAPIPQIPGFQAVGTNHIYAPSTNSIYSIITGQTIWTSTTPSTMGAVAGPYVVFASGSKVFIDTY